MAKEHFVMLAQDYVPGKHRIGGQFVSEKLDGIRAIWDGGITRGLDAAEVPWCNTAKHDRLTFTLKSTGLWSRYGQPIQAPAWWLDSMPRIPLDGELWAGRGMWQALCRAVKVIKEDSSFLVGDIKVRMMAFDSPSPGQWLKDRLIDVPNMFKKLEGCVEWFYNQEHNWQHLYRSPEYFVNVNKVMPRLLENCDYVDWHEQIQLPYGSIQAESKLEEIAKKVYEVGGEGLVIRQSSSSWLPERSYDLLKVKPESDAEATIVGYKWGKKTTKGSKLLGKMGSLICQLVDGKQFELSGFTDAERAMVPISGDGYNRMQAIAEMDQGKRVIEAFHNPKFPIGSVITFKYREWSDDGLPKEARFYRRRHEVSAS